MLFLMTHICVNERDNAMLISVMNKMVEIGAKVTKNGAIMVFSYYYVVHVETRFEKQ